MTELIAALGLALAIEGLLCAAAPDTVRRAMIEVVQTPRERLRTVGIVTALLRRRDRVGGAGTRPLRAARVGAWR